MARRSMEPKHLLKPASRSLHPHSVVLDWYALTLHFHAFRNYVLAVATFRVQL